MTNPKLLVTVIVLATLILASCGTQAPANNKLIAPTESKPVKSQPTTTTPTPAHTNIETDTASKLTLAQIEPELERLDTRLDEEYDALKGHLKKGNEADVRNELNSVLRTEQKRRKVIARYTELTKKNHFLTYPILWNDRLDEAGELTKVAVSKFSVPELEKWKKMAGTIPSNPDGVEVWFTNR